MASFDANLASSDVMMASFDANSTPSFSISFVAHANPACESPFVVVFVLWYLKDDEVMDGEVIRELLFSSSADDDDIPSVDLLVMDWMDFSSTWMMPPPQMPMLLLWELEVCCVLLR